MRVAGLVLCGGELTAGASGRHPVPKTGFSAQNEISAGKGGGQEEEFCTGTTPGRVQMGHCKPHLKLDDVI